MRPDAASPADWARAVGGLRRVGAEYQGACPLCGGRDRFHVRPGHTVAAVVGCRGCEASFHDLRTAAFGPDPATPPRPPLRLVHGARPHASPPTPAPDPLPDPPPPDAARARARSRLAAARHAAHPYTARKGAPDARPPVGPDGWIVLPIHALSHTADPGPVISAQRISPDGAKRFEWGAPVKGGGIPIGPTAPGGLLAIVEGYATGLSVRAALHALGIRRVTVLAMLSAAGVRDAARFAPHRPTLVVADHDPNDIGLDAARAVERAGAQIVMPRTRDRRPPCDANDVHVRDGLHALAAQIAAALAHDHAAQPDLTRTADPHPAAAQGTDAPPHDRAAQDHTASLSRLRPPTHDAADPQTCWRCGRHSLDGTACSRCFWLARATRSA